ncbi:MAG: DNA repair protein RecO [Candidatus Marinimicrobia bacterium]|nr:DNA repair protein RecO [Candidatus Neomarinimicrobiota bacterium]MBT6869998.1 DNA repair protein RecO [Candidatus Neomarinimicrobiota bacterium]
MIVSTDAIVLRTVNYSETSIIVTLFAKESGKITLMAKGARKPKSPFSAQLEPMNILNLNYFHKDGRNIQLLKNSSFIENSLSIRERFDSLNYGLTIIEVLDKLIHENDIDPIIYRLSIKTLSALKNSSANYDIMFSFFLLQLSIRLGFMPELNQCCNCSNILESAKFDEHRGELICENCVHSGEINFSPGTIKLLQALLKTHIDSLHSLKYEEQNLKELDSFLDYYSKFHLEGMTKVKSLKILRELVHG